MNFPKFYSTLITLSALSFSSQVNADDVVLAGWHDFSSAHQAHKSLNTAKAATSDIDNVSGLLYGGDGARHTWGSTDGTYGPTQATSTTATNGSMSIRADFSNVRFKITNGTKRNIHLNKIVFDFASINGNSPQNLRLYYESGDLTDANETLLVTWQSILNGLSNVSDYEDREPDLSMLGDQILGPGQEATFRFQVDTANVSNQALGLDNIAILGDYADFSIITYNIHGGVGPADEGTPLTNLTAFRDNFMNDEDVLCLQEVNNGDCWDAVQAVFSDYPYRYRTINETTGFIWPWESQQQTSIVVLSKYPFESTHNQLIQTDPGGDEWERHAQYVTIKLGEETLHIFHFHNTYNFNNNDFASEKEGMVKFRDNYVFDQLNISSLAQADKLIMLGDFNILHEDVTEIIPTTSHKYNGRDHINTMKVHSLDGHYTTVAAKLSDHPAVWANMDIESPSPNPMTWESTPTPYGAGAIRMEATAAFDPNEVEYYFINTTISDGSHDSGWQSSPIYIDSGLSDGVTYFYSVIARDKSSNANATGASVTGSATAVINTVIPPYMESFEQGHSGDWAQSTSDDYNWDINSGGTDTAAAGPSEASDGTYYFYAEGHHGLGRYKSASIEACFDFNGMSHPIIQFDYHMYGTYIDYLALDVYDGTNWVNDVWVRNGQQHTTSTTPWTTAEVDLSAYAGNTNVKLRMRTANAFWNAADPAIDNIRLDEELTLLYEPWVVTAFSNASTESDTSPSGDADQDGMNNELEWILNTDPLVQDSAMSDLLSSATGMTFEYTRRKLDNVSIYAEWSSTLTESSWKTTNISEIVTADDGELQTVSVTIPIDEDRKFVRIKVQKN